MPIVNADAARWSNAAMAGNAHEQRVQQGGKEHTGGEATNATSAAHAHEARCSQEQGTH